MAGMLFLPAWLLLSIGLFVAMSIIAATAYHAGYRRRAMSAVLVLVALVLTYIAWPAYQYFGDYLFFYRIHNSLQSDVEEMPGPDSEKLKVWLEGGLLFAVNGFAYDGSDEMARPAGKQSETWRKRAAHTEFSDDCFDAHHITGHYYSFTTDHGCDFLDRSHASPKVR